MSETDPAARAFEDLCAEMTVLRRSMEALPQAWRDNRPPDYTEDLARVVKAMNAVGTRMKAIEDTPTLKMTPQAYGQGIREEGKTLLALMEAFTLNRLEVRSFLPLPERHAAHHGADRQCRCGLPIHHGEYRYDHSRWSNDDADGRGFRRIRARNDSGTHLSRPCRRRG